MNADSLKKLSAGLIAATSGMIDRAVRPVRDAIAAVRAALATVETQAIAAAARAEGARIAADEALAESRTTASAMRDAESAVRAALATAMSEMEVRLRAADATELTRLADGIKAIREDLGNEVQAMGTTIRSALVEAMTAQGRDVSAPINAIDARVAALEQAPAVATAAALATVAGEVGEQRARLDATDERLSAAADRADAAAVLAQAAADRAAAAHAAADGIGVAARESIAEVTAGVGLGMEAVRLDLAGVATRAEAAGLAAGVARGLAETALQAAQDAAGGVAPAIEAAVAVAAGNGAAALAAACAAGAADLAAHAGECAAARAVLGDDVARALAGVAAVDAAARGATVASEEARAADRVILDSSLADIARRLAAIDEQLESTVASAAGLARSAGEDAARHLATEYSELRSGLNERFADLQREVLAQVAAVQPKEGRPGRDASVSPPVPYESGKAYPFSTWAKHKGGLWFAFRDTDAEPDATKDSGWTLIIDGITGVDLTNSTENPRDSWLEVRLASGATDRLPIHIPAIIGRGVWLADTIYDRGDSVTHSGSSWTAKRKSRGAKPGQSDTMDDWGLTTKRGKDGVNAPSLPMPVFLGMYDPEKTYNLNNVVRTKTAVWWCLKNDTTEPPSSKSKAWALVLSVGDD